MKKINLNLYKEFKQYFIFYDVIIKKVKSNKEEWLKEKGLSPSSYRRAKEDGNKIGIELLKELNMIFSYKTVDEKLIDEIEKKINEIYFNIYYKKNDLYDENINWIDAYLKEKYIIEPVLLLFKLLLIVNSKIDPKRILVDYIELYNEVQKYMNFFNEDLLEVVEIINISFQNDINEEVLSKTYKNELSYFTLSSKCILNGRYIEALYFADKAKQIFIKEENAKRIYHINLNLMSAYNYLEKYSECNLLAQKQMLALESYKCYENEYIFAQKHYIVSCLGLGEYNKIVDLLARKNGLNKTEFCCLLISKYKIDRNEYINYYNSLITSINCSKHDLIYFELVDKFINKNDKRLIEEIEKHKLTNSVIKILKKM